jgi:glutamine synthetase
MGRGVYATFMPKPLQDQNGSGMHVHMSLSKGEENVFYDPDGEYKLSTTAKQFIAGLLRHAPEIACVCNQWVNSYKRLVPGFEAPAYATWAAVNRFDLVRIPSYRPGREASVRIEFRQPDPACNPYLVFAAILTAGLEGIEQGYAAIPPAESDVTQMTDEERASRGIVPLPGSLLEALAAAEGSSVLLKALGEHTYQGLIQNKRIEWDSYRSAVTDFELKRYLPNL